MNFFERNLLFLTPYPDGELVTSFLRRLPYYDGSLSLIQVSKRLLRRKVPTLDDMPCDLGMFYREIGYLYGSMADIVGRHTSFDMICCGLPRTSFSQQLSKLEGRLNGPVRLCKLPLFFVSQETGCWQCPECVTEQRAQYGFTYVHRRICIPYVTMCHIHGIAFRPVAPNASLYAAFCRRVPDSYQRRMCIEYSRHVETCLETLVENSPYHKDAVAQRLRESGWVSDSGLVRRVELIENFACFFAGAFSDIRLALLVREPQYIEVAIRAIFNKVQTVHPVWCVLFYWFANICVSVPGRHRHAIVPGSAAVDKSIVESHLQSEGSLTGAAKAMKIDAMRLSLLCRQLGIPVKTTTDRYSADFLTEIYAAVDRGDSRHEIAKSFDLSDTTTSRLISLRPRAVQLRMDERTRLTMEKRSWAAAVKGSRDSTTATLHHEYRRTWSYLKRHAPEWLRAHPGKGRMTPHGRRAACPSKLKATVHLSIEKAAALVNSSVAAMPTCRIAALTGLSEHAIKSFLGRGRGQSKI